MWEKEKTSKPFSTGILVLVLLLLSIQLCIFIKNTIVDLKYRRVEKISEQENFDNPRNDSILPIEEENEVQLISNLQIEDKQVPKSIINKAENIINEEKPNHLMVESNIDNSGNSLKKDIEDQQYHSYPIEINIADTSDFNSLYGIGDYFSNKIVEYRQKLGGSFVSPEQLMEIWGIDSVRYNRFKGRLYVKEETIIKFDLFTLDEESLSRHPYIGSYAAKGIIRFRKMVNRSEFSIDKLVEYNIISEKEGEYLKLYQK